MYLSRSSHLTLITKLDMHCIQIISRQHCDVGMLHGYTETCSNDTKLVAHTAAAVVLAAALFAVNLNT